MFPWYWPSNADSLKLSRSYFTGFNADYDDIDNYCGEIVVADFNFDGLEDFATPIDQGASNGPHYAFYIQNKKGKFELSSYLTENIIWFPTTWNKLKRSFTTEVPCGATCLMYNTYKFQSNTNSWKKTDSSFVDIVTGKKLK